MQTTYKHRNVHQANLQAVESFAVIDQTPLKAASIFRDVHQAVLKAGESSLIKIDATALPADKLLSADVDDTPLNAMIIFVVIDNAPTETRTVARAAIDEAQSKAVLGIFTPDVQRQTIDGRRSRLHGNIRCQRKLNRRNALCISRSCTR